MKSLTPELIAKARAAKSAEELLELAGANGVDLTEEEAKICFEQLSANDTVSDDELDVVAGGGLSCPSDDEATEEESILVGDTTAITGKCSKCGCTEIVASSSLNSGKLYICKKCRELAPNATEKRVI
jgi:hypothetical protein